VAIQPVISPGDVRSTPGPPDLIESLRQHFLLSEEALGDAPSDTTPRLLIWPESPMNMSLDEDPAVEQLLEDFARARNVYLLVNHLGRAPGGGFHNSAAVISPEGRRVADYHKTHLLIFGEYVPFRHVLPLVDRIPALAGDFIPGTELTVVSMGPARVGTFICFESTFPSIARTMVRRGANVLVNISNDGWFGATAGAYQHLAHAVFRAVETGRPLVRVTNSGITALITPQGEIRDATELFQPATRRWQIPVPTATASIEHSFYTRYGDWFVLVCGLASLVIMGRALPFHHHQLFS
jgi:apolipoprotein N-acyltransferase